MPAHCEQMVTTGASARFDTRFLPRSQRLDFWNQVNSESFSRISIDPRSENLRGVLERHQCGALKIGRVYSTPSLVHGGLYQPSTEEGNLLIHMQDLGSSVNTQIGRSTVLRPGDITFCDAGRPYTVECKDALRMLVVNLPRELLIHKFGGIERFVGLHVDGTRGVGAILASLIRNIWLQCNDLDNWQAECGGSLVNALLDLMPLLHTTSTAALQAPSVSALRDQMRIYIDNRLSDPQLSVNSLAGEFSITARHVHRVFAEMGTTPSNYILELRLNRAANRLRDVRRGDTITHVAFESGFGDSTSFSRAFRKRYGVSPREYRHPR